MRKKVYNGFFSLCLFVIGVQGFAMEGDQNIARYPASGDVKAIALVVHGFNAKPEIMEEVIGLLNEQGITCLLAKLSGHRGDHGQTMTAENWLNDWREAFTEAQKTAKVAGLRFFVVGHSMGCLVNSCHMADTDNLESLAGCIYFAPADGLKSVWRSLLPLALIMPGNGQLTGMGQMFSGGNAAQNDMPVCGFAGLNNLLSKSSSSSYSKVPTLVLMDPKDLLIDCNNLKSLISSQELESFWEMVKLTETDDPMFAHMSISSGHPGFQEIKECLPDFISRCLASKEVFKPGYVKAQAADNKKVTGCAQQ